MRGAFVAVACAVLAAVVPAPARAANGQLAAVAENKLIAVNPDGTGLRTLWNPGGAIADLAWSPDGNALALVYDGKIVVLDLRDRSLSYVTDPKGERDADPTWSADGAILGFRRVGLVQRRMQYELATRKLALLPVFDVAPTSFAYAPTLKSWAFTIGSQLFASEPEDLALSSTADGRPAWSPDAKALAYVDTGSRLPRVEPGLHVLTIGGGNQPIADLPATAPRWSGDGGSLVYIKDGTIQTVPATQNAMPVAVPGVTKVTGVDWQPCVVATTSCVSKAPPTCTTLIDTARTQVDQAVALPPAPCTDPNSLPLTFLLVKGPEHGTLDRTVYTPGAGFSGQDTVTYKVSNGASESEVIKVTIFVVPRPAPTGPPAGANPPAVPVAVAPFLSLRLKPHLDRKRATIARLACDQACSFTIQLQAKVRVKGKRKRVVSRTLRSKAVHRSLTPGSLLALKLKLPAKPAGRLKAIWITGTVRGATGESRSVKLPVTPPR